jgi:hypothetical protein
MARLIARRLGFTTVTYPANWFKFGKAAGPKRNQEMLNKERPDFVLAFHNDIGNSRGTKDMVNRAHKARIPVHLHSSDKINDPNSRR